MIKDTGIKVIKSYWFHPMNQPTIGIVQVLTGWGKSQHYIGCGKGINKEEDEQLIIEAGARFCDLLPIHPGSWVGFNSE